MTIAFMICFAIIMLVMLVKTGINSVKSGQFAREKKRLGIWYYVGMVPILVLALAAVILSCMNKSLEAFAACFLMMLWGMTAACFLEVNRKNK
ncbi:MAG: hypothetical protein SPL83_01800 [Succinivibrio sp.]|nr:hypothetical protein [Succinivibrio sp.]